MRRLTLAVAAVAILTMGCASTGDLACIRKGLNGKLDSSTVDSCLRDLNEKIGQPMPLAAVSLYENHWCPSGYELVDLDAPAYEWDCWVGAPGEGPRVP